MGPGARGAWAALALGLLVVVALLKAAMDGLDSPGSASSKTSVLPENSNIQTDPAGNPPQTPITIKPTNSSTETTTTTSKPATKSTAPPTSSTVTVHVTTLKPNTTSTTKTVASTTMKSTPKTTSVSKTTPLVPTSMMTTSHNSSGTTSAHSLVSNTTTINSKEKKGSNFDIGSFVGGIVLTLGILSFFMLDAKCIIPEEAFATVPLMNTKSSFKALQGPMGKVFKMTG